MSHRVDPAAIASHFAFPWQRANRRSSRDQIAGPRGGHTKERQILESGAFFQACPLLIE
jgi:hypothetical protein